MPLDQFNIFPPADQKLWAKAASHELDGADPFKKLSLQYDGLVIKPYYDATDIDQEAIQPLPPGDDAYRGPRDWQTTAWIETNDIKVANQLALQQLQRGADGIFFILKDNVDIQHLLHGIEWRFCSLFFWLEHGQEDFLETISHYVRLKKINPAQIAGGIFWKSLPSSYPSLLNQYAHWEKFRPTGLIVDSGSGPVMEIAKGLACGVEAIDKLTDSGLGRLDAFSSLSFSFSIHTHLFLEIAKLKAFRMLWKNIEKAYGLPGAAPAFIHGLSGQWCQQAYEPNGNMLKSTTSAIAAILGGCNAITIEPSPDVSPLSQRIALNVLNILRDESHLNRTADATAGSYYLESLTSQLAKAAWHKFQNLAI